MSSNTFTPGGTPNTVLTVTAQVLTAPEGGFSYLPAILA